MTPMVADNDVDLETLQAQVDMTMSFAHNLVESWIKPIHRAQPGCSGANASQILEKDLHRPPRLGVGASIPMAPPLAHEASKLKRRLGKHAAKNDAVVESQLQESDNEEHKGRSSKRKVKADPFAHASSKKKRKLESNSHPSAEDISKRPGFLLKNPCGVEPKNNNPPSRKDKHQTVRSSQTILSTDLTTTVAPCSEPSRETSAPVLEIAIPGSNRVRASSIPLDDMALGIPLLNLDGPPKLTDKPDNARESNNSKRKRKRRKKKKPRMNANTQDGSH